MDASHPRVALRDAHIPVDASAVLWVDARTDARDPGAATALAGRCPVTRIDAREPFDPAIERLAPRVVCLEFDTPDALARRLVELACAIVGALTAAPPAAQRPTRSRSTRAALALIEANLHRRVSLAECARACALSPCEFSRRFREEHGVNFSTHLLRLRVERAQTLLAAAPRPVSEVAFAVGFNDLSYFARIFRRFAGVTASAWQARHAEPRPNG
jgi:AraC-like DNA-binding protein